MKMAAKKQKGNENNGESAPAGQGRAMQAELLSVLETAQSDFEINSQ